MSVVYTQANQFDLIGAKVRVLKIDENDIRLKRERYDALAELMNTTLIMGFMGVAEQDNGVTTVVRFGSELEVIEPADTRVFTPITKENWQQYVGRKAQLMALEYNQTCSFATNPGGLFELLSQEVTLDQNGLVILKNGVKCQLVLGFIVKFTDL
jgi:hypothetical protein